MYAHSMQETGLNFISKNNLDSRDTKINKRSSERGRKAFQTGSFLLLRNKFGVWETSH